MPYKVKDSREIINEWLAEGGLDQISNTVAVEAFARILKTAWPASRHKKIRNKKETNKFIQHVALKIRPRNTANKKPKVRPQKKTSEKSLNDFYKSWEWRRLRMKVLQKYEQRCMCCGAAPGDYGVGGEKVRIVVDHIKPIRHHWSLRLEIDNLQLLCDECNMGKGSWDETDHRPSRNSQITEQLKYSID